MSPERSVEIFQRPQAADEHNMTNDYSQQGIFAFTYIERISYLYRVIEKDGRDLKPL